MSVVFHIGQVLVVEIGGLSARVMAHTGGAREFVEPDCAQLINSMRTVEGTVCDHNRLRGITSKGVVRNIASTY